MLKLQGLNTAIGNYHRANSGGPYSPRYGYLMLDKSTGLIWCDEFYSLGHNEWISYHSSDIINLGIIMENQGYEIDRESVKEFCFIHYQILSKYLKAKYVIDVFDGSWGYYLDCENYKDALSKYAKEQEYYSKNKSFDEYCIELNKYTESGHLIQTLFRTAKCK